MSLLKTKQFAPFFWTQFFGAFNDNLFKNAMVLLISFTIADEAKSGMFINVAAGLFILPFFLFSPIAGQLADKYSKSTLIFRIKLAEIVIMIFGGIAYYYKQIELLLFILFLMGTQSAFFGPVKFSIMPQTLKEDELMEGTGLVEMGTFIAILLGTIAGGIAYELSPIVLTFAVIVVASLGAFVAKKIPGLQPSSPSLKLDFNPISQMKEMFHEAKKVESVFLSIMAISWFWFVGAVIMTQLPTYVKHFVGGDSSIVTLLLAVFTVSIAVGSVFCEKISNRIIELGLVPIGAIGLSFFIFDLFLIDYGKLGGNLTFTQLLNLPSPMTFLRIVFDLGCIGFFGSLFSVPLYAMIQHRSKKETCSQVIAANNVLNAVFMVASAVLTIVLYGIGLNTIAIFAVVAIMNLVVSFYVFLKLPEFLMRFFIWVLAKTTYSIRFEGRENVPHTGSVVVVANHISFVDWFILSAACQRPLRYMVYYKIFYTPALRWIFGIFKALPVASAKEDPKVKELAFSKVAEAVKNDDMIAIFPEGMITYDGKLNEFKAGYAKIASEHQIQVLPVVIHGLWGSFFSRQGGPAMKKMPKPKRRKITVKILPALNAVPSPEELQRLFEQELETLESKSVTGVNTGEN